MGGPEIKQLAAVSDLSPKSEDSGGPGSGPADPGNVITSSGGSAEAALYHDALEAANGLKKTHGALYSRDPTGFRKAVRKAHAIAFRRKPGPRQDPRIAEAARERAQGAKWPELYARFIDHYTGMAEFTKDLAEAGFRRRVNDYRQRDPRLRRKPKSNRKYK